MRLEEKLLCLRKERELTQGDLAEALNVSRQAVSKWETGRALPSAEKLRRLSELFGVSTDYLLNDEMEETEPKAVSEESDPGLRTKEVVSEKFAPEPRTEEAASEKSVPEPRTEEAASEKSVPEPGTEDVAVPEEEERGQSGASGNESKRAARKRRIAVLLLLAVLLISLGIGVFVRKNADKPVSIKDLPGEEVEHWDGTFSLVW